MAQGRSTPSLREIEPLLRDVTDAYHLGVHLGVPAEKLKGFERDHPRDVARQRTEAVSYWRNNCDNTTWDGLAEAVEKLGCYANLVKKLRERAQESSCQSGARIEGNEENFSTPPKSPGPAALDRSHTEDIFEHVSALPPVITAPIMEQIDESSLASATRKLKLDFTTLFTSVRLSLERQQVSSESVLSHLKGIEAIGPEIENVCVRESSETFDKTVSKSITSLEELFPAIAPYCSWFNHLLVENIIETFCEDDERLLQKWEKFKEKIVNYCKARLCKCPLDQFGEDHPHGDTTPVVMKIDFKWKAVKVTQLEVIRDTVTQILNIKPYNLYLRAVKNGCIELTFHLPNFVASKCLPPSSEQITALHNVGVIYIQHSHLWALATGSVANMEDLKVVVMKRVAEVEVREKTAESAETGVTIQRLQEELEYEQAERTRAEEKLQQKDALIQCINTELEQTRTQLQQKLRMLEMKQSDLTRQLQPIIQPQQGQLPGEYTPIESELMRTQMQQPTTEPRKVEWDQPRLHAELEDREARLRVQEEEMQRRDAEINRLMGELR